MHFETVGEKGLAQFLFKSWDVPPVVSFFFSFLDMKIMLKPSVCTPHPPQHVVRRAEATCLQHLDPFAATCNYKTLVC